jgi:hypothetical protein
VDGDREPWDDFVRDPWESAIPLDEWVVTLRIDELISLVEDRFPELRRHFEDAGDRYFYRGEDGERLPMSKFELYRLARRDIDYAFAGNYERGYWQEPQKLSEREFELMSGIVDLMDVLFLTLKPA